MNLSELTDLINIKAYVTQSINSSNIDRATANELNGMSILLDKKILKVLQSTEFKEFVGFSNVKEAIQEVRRLNDIKSSLKRV